MLTHLPIHTVADEIVETIKNNTVTVIKAETGSGKSTQLPQLLMHEGMSCLVCEPRRLAATSLATFVAQDFNNSEVGEVVGYQIGGGIRKFSAQTRCLYVTDGLGLIHRLVGRHTYDVLIIDELHEWNLNQSVLTAWVKREIALNPRLRVVLVSATIDAVGVAKFFDNAPIIEVPGRQYDVTEFPTCGDKIEDINGLVLVGHSVLVFEPGKQEIADTIQLLRAAGVPAEILPLHAEVSSEAQSACMEIYDTPKVIVATNVAEVSVTIPGITAVVDTGLRNIMVARGPINSLETVPTSLSERTQRKGRAGRECDGLYVDLEPAELDYRDDHPIPEIQRLPLDQVILTLAGFGVDARELEFYHQPSEQQLNAAFTTLHNLGCLDDDNAITPLGMEVSRLEVSTRLACMIVAARRHKVVRAVLAIAAMMESNPLNGKTGRHQPSIMQQLVPQDVETQSDAIGMLLVFDRFNVKNVSNDELNAYGINVKRFRAAQKLFNTLCKRFQRELADEPEDYDRTAVIKSVAAGMVDHLYRVNGANGFMDSTATYRRVTNKSLVDRFSAEDGYWAIGEPHNFGKTIHVITNVSVIEPEWLADIAPGFWETVSGLKPYYDPEKDAVVTYTTCFFRGVCVIDTPVVEAAHPAAPQLLAEWLAAGGNSHYLMNEINAVVANNDSIVYRARRLNYRAGRTVFPQAENLVDHYLRALGTTGRLQDVSDPLTLALEPIDETLSNRILDTCPGTLQWKGIEAPISYESNGQPRAWVEQSSVWLLPDGDYRLADGRTVVLTTHVPFVGDFEAASGIALKQLVRDALLDQAWKGFNNGFRYSRDEIIPVATDDPADLPTTVLQQLRYADDPMTGQPVYAYGYYEWLPQKGQLVRRWTRDAAEATRHLHVALAAARQFQVDNAKFFEFRRHQQTINRLLGEHLSARRFTNTPALFTDQDLAALQRAASRELSHDASLATQQLDHIRKLSGYLASRISA